MTSFTVVSKYCGTFYSLLLNSYCTTAAFLFEHAKLLNSMCMAFKNWFFIYVFNDGMLNKELYFLGSFTPVEGSAIKIAKQGVLQHGRCCYDGRGCAKDLYKLI